MDLFDDTIGMRITSCNWFPFEAIVFLIHIGKFSHEFGTTIKQNWLWEWVLSKPSFLGNICNFWSCVIGYFAISNQPVAGSIILRHHSLSGFLTFRGIVYGPIRSTHIMSHGLVSSCFCSSFPYLWLVVLDLFHVGNFLHTLWNILWRPFQ